MDEVVVATGSGVETGGGMIDEVDVVGFVVDGARVGVASALTLPADVVLIVLALPGLACGAGLADAFAGDCLATAAGTCNDIVEELFGGDIGFAGMAGNVAGAGLGLAFAPSLSLIGAAFGGRLSFNFACGGCGGSSTLAFAAVHLSFQYV